MTNFFSEIGACLVNLEKGEIEDRFQSYVRPTLFPRLSQFCINLTGIRQNLIDTEQTFNAVYLKLADWIERIGTEKNVRFATSSERSADRNGINATFGSWSDTDLQIFFKMECRRLHITALPCFTAWIDVRKSFDVSSPIPDTVVISIKLKILILHFFLRLQQQYPLGRCKFPKALQYAGINTIGQQHSAINDAENLAKLVIHLTKRGAQYKTTTSSCNHQTPVDYSY